jgi:hypothetical protein
MRLSFGNFTINSTKNETTSKKPVLTSKNTEIDLEFGDKENCFLEKKTLQAVNLRKKSIRGINDEILNKLKHNLLKVHLAKDGPVKKEHRRMTLTLGSSFSENNKKRRFSIREERSSQQPEQRNSNFNRDILILEDSNTNTKSSLYTLPRLSQKNLENEKFSPVIPSSLKGSRKILELENNEHLINEEIVVETKEKPIIKNNLELFEVLEQPSECERSEFSKAKSLKSTEIFSTINNKNMAIKNYKIKQRNNFNEMNSKYSKLLKKDQKISLFSKNKKKSNLKKKIKSKSTKKLKSNQILRKGKSKSQRPTVRIKSRISIKTKNRGSKSTRKKNNKLIKPKKFKTLECNNYNKNVSNKKIEVLNGHKTSDVSTFHILLILRKITLIVKT